MIYRTNCKLNIFGNDELFVVSNNFKKNWSQSTSIKHQAVGSSPVNLEISCPR